MFVYFIAVLQKGKKSSPFRLFHCDKLEVNWSSTESDGDRVLNTGGNRSVTVDVDLLSSLATIYVHISMT